VPCRVSNGWIAGLSLRDDICVKLRNTGNYRRIGNGVGSNLMFVREMTADPPGGF